MDFSKFEFGCGVHDLRDARQKTTRRFVGRFCETPVFIGTASAAADALQFKRAQAARARKCMRQETAIRPTAESTPEFSKIERPEQVPSPTGHGQSSCSCPTQSSWRHSRARRGSRPYAGAGAIAGKHSARAPTEMPRKQMPRHMHACNSLNASWCSLRCELLYSAGLTQENSLTIPAD
jgi:hypothetical protein